MHKRREQHPRERKGRESSEEIGFLSYIRLVGESDPQGWVFSSGATVHICNSRDEFEDYRPVTGKHVSLISGGRVDVAGIGSVTLRFTSGKTVTLTDVVHIPSSAVKFVSVGGFTNLGFDIIFDSGKVMIYKNNKFFANACNRGGLPILNVENDDHSGAASPGT